MIDFINGCSIFDIDIVEGLFGLFDQKYLALYTDMWIHEHVVM